MALAPQLSGGEVTLWHKAMHRVEYIANVIIEIRDDRLRSVEIATAQLRPILVAGFSAATKSSAGMKPRAFIGIGIVAAFFAALTIASSPELHEKLHKPSPQHECAATILSSGNCDHSAVPQSAPKLENLPHSPAFLRERFRGVIASVPSSVQEHAPPESR